MLLGILGASLLGNILAGKGAMATSHRRGINKKSKGAIATNQGRGVIRAGKGAKKSTRQGRGIVRAGYGHCSSKNKNNKTDF